jgi:integrase
VKFAQPREGEPIRLVVTKIGEPRYRVRLDAGAHATGKRRQVWTTHNTLTEARSHVDKHRADRARGVLIAPDRTTFEDYSKQWLARRSREVREITHSTYTSVLTHPTAAFGGKRVAQVTRTDIEGVVNALADKGRSRRTTALLLHVLRSIFEDALEDKLVTTNPARKVKPVGKEPKDRQPLTSAEITTLREHLSQNRLYAAWLLTLYGLRRSEVLGLRWADVNLTAATLTIERGRVLVGGKQSIEGPPKTARGARTITLPTEAVKALRKLRQAQLKQFGTQQVRAGHVVVNEVGSPVRHEWWSDEWKRQSKAAGVPVVNLHGARHSAVTTMREAGVPDHIVAAWHGHDEVIMRRTYSHVHPAGLAAAAEALSAAYRGKDAGGR